MSQLDVEVPQVVSHVHSAQPYREQEGRLGGLEERRLSLFEETGLGGDVHFLEGGDARGREDGQEDNNHNERNESSGGSAKLGLLFIPEELCGFEEVADEEELFDFVESFDEE